MTPGARVAAAIECLDRIVDGEAAERVLTRWARAARYAGSKDRAAIRDHVYDVLRRKRACAAMGGSGTGRGLMLGLVRLQGGDEAALFSGVGHAPAPLSAEERTGDRSWDRAPEVPSWLIPRFEAVFGAEANQELAQLERRAAVFLRVNTRKADRDTARAQLAHEGILAEPFAMAETALRVTEGARRIAGSLAYRDGVVELQDAAGQAAMATLPLRPGMKVLDYCAGGGGKTLALAGRGAATFFAHDARPQRLRDLPARAARAGVDVEILGTQELERAGPFDLVLCDVPCSGSGTWRRDPDAKWRFSADMLDRIVETQARILDSAAALVSDAGMLAYATCSLLDVENEGQVADFVNRVPGWRITFSTSWRLSSGADGFYVAHLIRS